MAEQDGTKPADTSKHRVLVVLLAFVSICVGAQTLDRMLSAPRYEYLIDAPSDSDLPTRLDALGEQGWDIVSARRAVVNTNGGASEGRYEIILRRVKRLVP